MRGIDEETGEFRGPSRSQQRREALEVRTLAETLVELPPARLARLPIPEQLLPHIHDTQKITAHIARKRQLQFLAKQMRREDDDTLHAISDALDAGGEASRQETALLHRVEAWRERLLEDGDAALAALIAEHPQVEAQQLRQLVRNSHAERKKNKPPRAFRELFRLLRGILEQPEDSADGE
ncbi:ribosome biogenesis factor YjgA [Luteimonas sp. MJ293]|uniref:ribosome biogenesis factor YjgA n=1 Tax=Luteimonas sp. MJ146 TaxID=3129240 RepID=UPI0031B9CD3C